MKRLKLPVPSWLLRFVLLPLLILWLLFMLVDNLIMPMISRSGSEFPLPKIVGRTETDAEELLRDIGLTLQITGREYSPEKPEGVVLTQIPPAGMMVKTGRTVKAIISAGVKVVKIPDVFGLPLRQADLTLQKAGFSISSMYWVHVDSLPEGVAVETIPSKGVVLPLGSQVALAVNQGAGSNWVFMPSLTGLPFKKVQSILDSLGLPIGEVIYVRDTLLLPNTVVEQRPTRNAQVMRGDSVHLTVTETD
jgi:beta-lactam-binding protein with PASTA domain